MSSSRGQPPPEGVDDERTALLPTASSTDGGANGPARYGYGSDDSRRRPPPLVGGQQQQQQLRSGDEELGDGGEPPSLRDAYGRACQALLSSVTASSGAAA